MDMNTRRIGILIAAAMAALYIAATGAGSYAAFTDRATGVRQITAAEDFTPAELLSFPLYLDDDNALVEDAPTSAVNTDFGITPTPLGILENLNQQDLTNALIDIIDPDEFAVWTSAVFPDGADLQTTSFTVRIWASTPILLGDSQLFAILLDCADDAGPAYADADCAPLGAGESTDIPQDSNTVERTIPVTLTEQEVAPGNILVLKIVAGSELLVLGDVTVHFWSLTEDAAIED
jgi:hypothetical protein